MTTEELLREVRNDPMASPREIHLADKLAHAIDELRELERMIDELHAEIEGAKS